MKLLRLAAIVVAVITLGVSATAASANSNGPNDANGPNENANPRAMDGWVRGQAALDAIGDRLPEVAQANGLVGRELESLLLEDDTLAVDSNLNLAYFDLLAPDEIEGDGGTSAAAAVAAPPVTGPEFQLASVPSATKTIYLDFDGHTTTGTEWNNSYGSTLVSPPYDRDGDTNTWSAEELQIIRDSWAVVAEDYAPWDVNVTTIDPGVDALTKSGSGDTTWGIRVVMTDDTFASCGCGGHAYIGSFNWDDTPTFVYNSSFTGLSEAISHEVGHSLYLAHDGSSTSGYYEGHGTGDTSWSAIMGVAYYVNVGQWSNQTYWDANNAGSSSNYGYGADDTAIIASQNGFGVKADDHGDSSGGATALVGDNPSVTGLIATRNDVDVFSFSTASGTATFTATPAGLAPNLDIEIRVRDNTGALVAVGTDASTLGASLIVSLVAGDYTVEIDGVGVGNETINPPTGYSDYGSLGVYTLDGSFDSTPPPPPPPPSDDASANGETTFAGSVSGNYTATFTADGTSQTLTEVQSGGKPRKRHDTLDHQWTFASSGGVQTLSIVAAVADAGDLDNGFSLEWSDDGSSWVALGTLTGSVSGSYLLGSPTGTVWVRVIDTDSTGRELNFDSISVDFLQISGEEAGDPTTALVTSMSTSKVSAGRGNSYGRVTVTVQNELGQPVSGAVVSFDFNGDFTDARDVVTNGSGVATFTTASAVKKPNFEVCVTNVAATGLTYSGDAICQDG